MDAGAWTGVGARRELGAAGVPAALRPAYLRSRALNAEHGRTYFLATRLLPPSRRPAVHALYGFARWVDDIVDETGPGSPAQRAERLDVLEHRLRPALATGTSEHPVLAALADTAQRHRIDRGLFADFLASMRMDLTVTDYPTRRDLERYVHGSAAVIGLQLLPVLGTVGAVEDARAAAAALGVAFQLTNFLRDVGEDLDRGRVYLPADELAVHGVDRERLAWCRRRGRPDGPVRRALADQVARTRAHYRTAEPGIGLLAPESRPCVRTAAVLYGEILDHVVASGYDVFARRVAVPVSRRVQVAARGAGEALVARVLRGGLAAPSGG
ncbi:phytoene/squalene synthase family protein [Saccharopolyspora rhizosphaerae]|uniref:Phytoene/squalene synthase family protein n=1 Tax=Saccharopolyspora rhizosphaerae TaxID=2492662 RepID=A0A3R8R854_9PSEU|nr:phytoene/squalene synthase family protein [Saccharopolyspora rhizosphaerae]RRO20586.1 phytoene/squalene synthase family protein [Saccharopolyspora rhizosphaerae]